MADIAVDAARIKTIRKARKIGRPKLAKLSGLTERQVAKLETSGPAVLEASVLLKLSEVLQVPAPTLTGEFEILADDLEPMAAKKCTSGCCG
ncbi:MAG: hypothetical protein Rhims3KO_35630 [Hyphomicrobiales bacterium]